MHAYDKEGQPLDTNSMTSPKPDHLYAIYKRLLASVTNEQGYGGPVCHQATVDGWDLIMNQSDFGDLAITARNRDLDMLLGFEYYDGWQPFTLGTKPADLALITHLAEMAEWKDKLKR